MSKFLFLFFISINLFADEFEIFDGRVYNGKYYPRMDILEWNEDDLPSHMEFQNYGKNMPIDLSFELEEKNGKKVMKVHYFFKERNEHLCRRVLAPSNMKPDFYIYQDESDKDRNITFVSAHKLPEKKGRQLVQSKKYTPCDEAPAERMPASEKPAPKDGTVQERVPGREGAIGKDENSIPFSDW